MASVVWAVLVKAWEWECCGEPFAVGDAVAWKLLVDPRRDEELPAAALVPDATAPGAHEGQPGHVLRCGALTAWAPGEEVPRRGLLVADRHGEVPDDLPATGGTVRAIRVVAHEVRPSPAVPGSLERVPRTTVLRAVRVLPAAFASVERGALVDLEVR